MKTWIVSAFLFSGISSLSQKLAVVDSTRQPVPFATLEVPKRQLAFFADSKGMADPGTFDLHEGDTISISAIGYQSRKIAWQKVNIQVVLKRQVIEMQEVVMNRGKWKKENWGSLKNPGLFGYNCGWVLSGPGAQIGKVIQNPGTKPAWIYKVVFYTQHAKDTRSPVRLRIYSLSEHGGPGNDLLQESVVSRLDKGKGWLEFDISDHAIRMPLNGLIVAAEYFDADTSNWRVERMIYKDSTGRKVERTDIRYGGSFATNDESGKGATWQRSHGQWYRHFAVPDKDCHNLVVQVWVKYPD